ASGRARAEAPKLQSTWGLLPSGWASRSCPSAYSGETVKQLWGWCIETAKCSLPLGFAPWNVQKKEFKTRPGWAGRQAGGAPLRKSLAARGCPQMPDNNFDKVSPNPLAIRSRFA